MSFERRLRLMGCCVISLLSLQAALVIWLTVWQPLHPGLLFDVGAAFSSVLAHANQIVWTLALLVLVRVAIPIGARALRLRLPIAQAPTGVQARARA